MTQNDDATRLAELVVEKASLDERLKSVRYEVKKLARTVKLPIAVEVDGNAVLIKKPPYSEGMPQTVVVPLLQ